MCSNNLLYTAMVGLPYDDSQLIPILPSSNLAFIGTHVPVISGQSLSPVPRTAPTSSYGFTRCSSSRKWLVCISLQHSCRHPSLGPALRLPHFCFESVGRSEIIEADLRQSELLESWNWRSRISHFVWTCNTHICGLLFSTVGRRSMPYSLHSRGLSISSLTKYHVNSW